MSRIRTVIAREVFDASGRPAVEAEVHTSSGAVGVCVAPSPDPAEEPGKLKELRDGDAKRFSGAGVLRAVDNIKRMIAPALRDADPADQKTVDRRMLEVDGRSDRSRLGTNAIMAVSLAAAHAAAADKGILLYEHLADLFGGPRRTGWLLPRPMFNVLSGDPETLGGPQIRNFLCVPVGAGTVRRSLEMIDSVRAATVGELRSRGLLGWPQSRPDAEPPGLGEPLRADLRSDEQAVEVIAAAIGKAGLKPASEVAIGLDIDSPRLGEAGGYRLCGKVRTAREVGDLFASWAERFPLAGLEDPLGGNDWAGWADLTKRLGGKMQLVADALFAGHKGRVDRGAEEGCGNAIIIKLHRMVTVSETLDLIRFAQSKGFSVVVSARGGASECVTAPHLAVATAAGHIKFGDPTDPDRMAKLNELLRIEDRLGLQAAFPGRPAPAAKPPGPENLTRVGFERRFAGGRAGSTDVLRVTTHVAVTTAFEPERRLYALGLIQDIVGRGRASPELASEVRKLADTDPVPAVRQAAVHVWKFIADPQSAAKPEAVKANGR
jgi:enolase